MQLPTLTAPILAWFLDGDSDRERTTQPWWPVVARLAGTQHGVVGRDQLLARGIPAWAIDGWVKRGLLHVWHQGVYSVGHRALGVAGRRLAAVLACGEEAGLFAQTAGDLLGVRSNAGGTVHVWVPGQKGRKIDGIRPHRDSDVLPEDFLVVEGIRTVNAMRVLVDMASLWDLDTLLRAFGRTEVNRQFDLHTLNAIIARRPRRPGIRKLRRVMETYEGPLPDLSALEKAGVELVKRAGLPIPEPQCHLAAGRVDFHWPERALILEMDSLRWHGTRWAFEEDRRRDAEHLAAGIATVRVTWTQAHRRESALRLRRIYNNRPVVPSRR